METAIIVIWSLATLAAAIWVAWLLVRAVRERQADDAAYLLHRVEQEYAERVARRQVKE